MSLAFSGAAKQRSLWCSRRPLVLASMVLSRCLHSTDIAHGTACSWTCALRRKRARGGGGRLRRARSPLANAYPQAR
eukprot:3811803-Pleurochrysis_carterae.AAC.1